MKCAKKICFFSVFMLLATVSQAAIIIQYDSANPGVTSAPPNVVDSNVTPANLIAGSGITPQNFSTWNFTNWDPANTSYADAIADDEFWQWGFTVSGSDIELTTMDIRVDRSGTGPDDFEIKGSVNAGPEILLLSHDYNDSGSGVTFTDVDISALGTVTSGDVVSFTLGAFNSETTQGSLDLETVTFPGGDDGIVINGNVVPEPSSILIAAMALTAAGAVLMRSRLG